MPPLVILSDPQEIKVVFGASPAVLHPGAGAHLTSAFYGPRSFILCDEEAHRAGRSTVMPAFRRAAIQQPERSEMVARIASEEIDSWPLEQPFAAHTRLRALTLRVILHTIFGEQTTATDALRHRILDIPSATASLVVQQPLLRHLPGWRGTWRLYQQQRRDVYAITKTILQERRRHRSTGDDVLELVVAAIESTDQPMTEEQALDHLVSLMIAGHETTAAQLAWAVQLLAHHQPAQQRLTEEIDLGTETAYLTATVHETMRHRCVFLFAMPRRVARPIQIGQWTYRPPTHLLAGIHLLHHDPALFPDPEAFEPQRFLGSASTGSATAWGGGRRRCPGQHLALQEMEIALRALLARRTLQPAAPQIEIGRWRNAIIVPGNGAQTILRARHRIRIVAQAGEAERSGTTERAPGGRPTAEFADKP